MSATDQEGIGIFPKTKMDGASKFRLVSVTPSGVSVTELGALDVTFPFVDLFPDGRVLVAGARSEWRSESDLDRNGYVIEPGAKQVECILLGDGIQNFFIDAIGRIWVSYFDEGVFGNLGWGNPQSPAPVGAAGLVCFDAAGKILWEYSDVNSEGSIADCYALNVVGSDAYIYFYTEFPLCHISGEFSRNC